MQLIPDPLKKEIRLRIEKIKDFMPEIHAQAILVASNTNVYYTTGRFFRGYVYIPLEGEPVWFVIKPETFEREDNVFSIRKPEEIPSILVENEKNLPSSIGLEYKSITYSDILRLQKVFTSSETCDASAVLSKVRMIKTDYEIAQMKEDGLHQALAYSKVPGCYKPGMTDIELQIEIERVLRLEGCLGVSRTAGNLMEINLGSVIVGDNADIPGPYDFTMGGEGSDSSLPVGANGSIIKPGQAIMIDMNGAFNGYQTDMTRVWSLGELPEIAYKCHECSRRILRELEKISKPGFAVSEMYETAMKIVEEEKLAEWFMGHRSKVSFIGHGVGIELNEPPVVMKKSKDILAENMTIAIEPKFVLPGIGAVGVENTYRVTEEGLLSLTEFREDIMKL